MTTNFLNRLPVELDPIPEVGSNKRFIVEPVSATGLAFSPLPGNVGGFPLVILINDDQKRRHVVRGPQFLLGALQDARLTVDTSEGGGAPGDKWIVTILPAAEVHGDTRQRSDTDGFLQIRNAGERPLFEFNTAVDFSPFLMAFRSNATGLFYISPKDPRAFSLFTGVESDAFEAWDVGRFNHAALYVDQVSPSGKGLDWSMEPFVEATHSSDGRAMRYLSAGSSGQFGRAAADPWGAQPGYIILGAGSGSASTHTTEDAHMYSRLRFGLLVTANNHSWEEGPAGLEGLELRIKGVAW